MKIGDIVLIVKKNYFEDTINTSVINKETKTLWKCADGTSICKYKHHHNKDGRDSKYLYQYKNSYATVITRQERMEFIHNTRVNNAFIRLLDNLDVLRKGDRLTTKNKEDLINVINDYLENNFYHKEQKENGK